MSNIKHDLLSGKRVRISSSRTNVSQIAFPIAALFGVGFLIFFFRMQNISILFASIAMVGYVLLIYFFGIRRIMNLRNTYIEKDS